MVFVLVESFKPMTSGLRTEKCTWVTENASTLSIYVYIPTLVKPDAGLVLCFIYIFLHCAPVQLELVPSVLKSAFGKSSLHCPACRGSFRV
jgi:hypothetical protein